eukprot:52547-Rhodomonas_salina.2
MGISLCCNSGYPGTHFMALWQNWLGQWLAKTQFCWLCCAHWHTLVTVLVTVATKIPFFSGAGVGLLKTLQHLGLNFSGNKKKGCAPGYNAGYNCASVNSKAAAQPTHCGFHQSFFQGFHWIQTAVGAFCGWLAGAHRAIATAEIKRAGEDFDDWIGVEYLGTAHT